MADFCYILECNLITSLGRRYSAFFCIIPITEYYAQSTSAVISVRSHQWESLTCIRWEFSPKLETKSMLPHVLSPDFMLCQADHQSQTFYFYLFFNLGRLLHCVVLATLSLPLPLSLSLSLSRMMASILVSDNYLVFRWRHFVCKTTSAIFPQSKEDQSSTIRILFYNFTNFQQNCELSAENRLIYCATDVIHITTNTTPETWIRYGNSHLARE